MKRLFAQPILFLLSVYRYGISPWLGTRCRFLPTCSDYAKEAVAVHGPVKGSALAFSRLCKCHPLGGHGYDPVPHEKIS